jgi:hypothetical protein
MYIFSIRFWIMIMIWCPKPNHGYVKVWVCRVCMIRSESIWFVRESYDNGSSVRGNSDGMFSVVVLSWISDWGTIVMRTTRLSVPWPWHTKKRGQQSCAVSEVCYWKGWMRSKHSRFWWNGFHWPVLKHGPRSLTYMRVFGPGNPYAQWKWRLTFVIWGRNLWFRSQRHYRPISHLWQIWVWAYLLGPERWWSMPEQGEARGNSGGGS